MSKSQTLREPGVPARRKQKTTGVLIVIAAMDICSATFSIRERKGRRYWAQDMPRRTSRKRSDGWGAAAGCPYKCRILLMLVTVQRKPALCGAACQHMASCWSMSVF